MVQKLDIFFGCHKCMVPKMELFVKIANGWRLISSTRLSIILCYSTNNCLVVGLFHRTYYIFCQKMSYVWCFRSSRPEVFGKRGVLRNFAKFTGKHLCRSLFFNIVAGLRPTTFLKKILRYRCFPVNLVKFLRKPFLQNTSGRCFCTKR